MSCKRNYCDATGESISNGEPERPEVRQSKTCERLLMARIEFYMKFNKKNIIHTCCKALASTTI